MADQLYVVTAVSNPLNTVSRPSLARAFCREMRETPDVHLLLVEAALANRSYELADEAGPNITHIPVRHRTVLWHKESLLNCGLRHLPRDAQYVAWVDADLTFRTRTWAADAINTLHRYPIIQPWTTCYDLGPKDEHLHAHTSLASLVYAKKPVYWPSKQGYTPAHPGYAWAARRDVLEEMGGLYEYGILGAADRNMSMAILGRVEETFYPDISPQFAESLMAYQVRAVKATSGRMGCLPGTIEHSWHGAKIHRQYLTRPEILRKHEYNPVTDVYFNLDGIIELSLNKLDLQKDIDRYFEDRLEDANVNV